jgi:Aspartate/tyrosine/aromatic aminotransferase
MLNRLNRLGEFHSPFSNGVVCYSSSEGSEECKKAIINSIAAEIPNKNIHDLDCVITDGGSQAMELMLLGVSGTSSNSPLLVIDPLYTNYVEFANRLSIPISSVIRQRNKVGSYEKLDLNEIQNKIDKENPNGILIIPADNPTGYQMSQDTINEIAKMCVDKNIWLISDEAYRNIYYTDNGPTSIWNISNKVVPEIKGRRISIESVSKVWNACGLRIGALVTDNQVMFNKVRSEYTANLCANVIGQYIFGAIANLSRQEIVDWYKMQRKYYSEIITDLVNGLEQELPGLIISKPKASIYIVLDFSKSTPDDFNISEIYRIQCEI